MDYFEGVPYLRVHEKVFGTVKGEDFYFYRAVTMLDGLKPTQEYLDYLVTAYRAMPDVPQAYIESMAATEVLEHFLPPDQTGEFVRDIHRWPVITHPLLVFYEGCCLRLPLLVFYEGCCLRLVEFLWNRSLLQWMIKK